jgi:hypothetical protein
LPAQGILDESPAALRAEVEAELLIDVVADGLVGGVVQALENVLDFLEVIAVRFIFVVGRRIEGGVDFHLDHVSKVVFRIEVPLAQIA